MMPRASIRIDLRASSALAGFSLTVALSLALSACGPVGYVNQVTRKANASVAAAKAAGADKYAPYEYTRAVEYLHKAREEAAYSDFQAANRFGRKAHKAAMEAKKLSLQRAQDPDDTSWLPPPELRVKTDDGLAPADGDGSDDSGMAPADGDGSGLAPADGDGGDDSGDNSLAPADGDDSSEGSE